MLQTLVSSVRNQIEELESAKKGSSKKLKEGFSSLLEKLSARGDKLPLRMKLFLAQGMGTVDAYEKSTVLLEAVRKVPVPPPPAPLGDNATDEQLQKFKIDTEATEEARKYQHQAQYLLARNYRLAKDYPKALAVFNEMIGVVSAKAPTPKDKMGWAFKSMQVREEKARMLEEIAMSAPPAVRSKAWVDAVQEWIAMQNAFAPKLTALRVRLSPEEETRKIYLTSFQAPQGGEGFSEIDWAWIALRYGSVYATTQAKAAEEAKTAASSRERYFTLAFEQKRCSVMAYHSIGVSAAKSPEAYQEKFAALAKSFIDLQSPVKNPDFPKNLKTAIKELVASVPPLKAEYQKLLAAN